MRSQRGKFYQDQRVTLLQRRIIVELSSKLESAAGGVQEVPHPIA